MVELSKVVNHCMGGECPRGKVLEKRIGRLVKLVEFRMKCGTMGEYSDEINLVFEVSGLMGLIPWGIFLNQDGGLVVTFLNEKKYADIEFFGSESAVVVIKNLEDDRILDTFEVMPNEDGLGSAIGLIKDVLE